MTVGKVAFLLTLCVSDVMAVRSSSASEMCTEDDLLREEDAALEEHEIAASEKILAHEPRMGSMDSGRTIVAGTDMLGTLGGTLGSGSLPSRSLPTGSITDLRGTVVSASVKAPDISSIGSSFGGTLRSHHSGHGSLPMGSLPAGSLGSRFGSEAVSVKSAVESSQEASHIGDDLFPKANDALPNDHQPLVRHPENVINTQGLTNIVARESLNIIGGQKDLLRGRTHRNQLQWWEKQPGEWFNSLRSLKPITDHYSLTHFPNTVGSPDNLPDIKWRDDKIQALLKGTVFEPIWDFNTQMKECAWGQGTYSTYKIFPGDHRMEWMEWVGSPRGVYYQPYDVRRSYTLGPSKRHVPKGLKEGKIEYRQQAVPWTGINMYEFYMLAKAGHIAPHEFLNTDEILSTMATMADAWTYFSRLTPDWEVMGIIYRAAEKLPVAASRIRMKEKWDSNFAPQEYKTSFDLAFAIDCTSSMERWIQAVKKCVENEIGKYMNDETKWVRVALVAYRDLADAAIQMKVNPIEGKVDKKYVRVDVPKKGSDKGKVSEAGSDNFFLGPGRTIQPDYYKAMSDDTLVNIHREYPRFMDFTREPTDIIRILHSLTAAGGADYPEDVTGALWKALQLNWFAHTRLLFLITDAPPHGSDRPNRAGIPGKIPGRRGKQLFYDWLNKGADPSTKPDDRSWTGIGEVFDDSYHSTEDDYPNGDPSGLSVGDLLTRLRASSVDLHVLTVGGSSEEIAEINRIWGSALSTKYLQASIDPIEKGMPLSSDKYFQEVTDPLMYGRAKTFTWDKGHPELLTHKCYLKKMTAAKHLDDIAGAINTLDIDIEEEVMKTMVMELAATVANGMADSLTTAMATDTLLENSMKSSMNGSMKGSMNGMSGSGGLSLEALEAHIMEAEVSVQALRQDCSRISDGRDVVMQQVISTVNTKLKDGDVDEVNQGTLVKATTKMAASMKGSFDMSTLGDTMLAGSMSASLRSS